MKENKILISILVPTYNRVKYLEECLDSITEQEGFNLKELELIVSDNSEGDETKDFMNKYINKYKNWNIQYNRNENNLGMVGNWNKLLELKKGEYFIFLSDDDKFYNKNSLKKLYDNLLKYKLDVCYGKYRLIDGEGNDKGSFGGHTKIGNNQIYYDSFDEQIKGHTISFGGILYKDFGYRYDYKMGLAADWTMNLTYLYNKKVIGLLNTNTFFYREYENNSMKKSNICDYIQWEYKILKNFHVKWLYIKTLLYGIIFYISSLRLYKYFLGSNLGSKIVTIIKKIFGYSSLMQ